ncbi:hypothetical protein Syun_013004 [Stephania yunnanensis]|uniref:Uncharacterized protein n=1 Tax=Stephania yunnanensis TaxID=152371 RepID=A0AAP0PI42_9MAGN
MNHEAWGDQMASYMSQQVVAVTKGLINYLGHGHDQGKSEFGGWDDNGGCYKWRRLQMGAIMVLLIDYLDHGRDQGAVRNGGRFHPSGKQGGRTALPEAGMLGRASNRRII